MVSPGSATVHQAYITGCTGALKSRGAITAWGPARAWALFDRLPPAKSWTRHWRRCCYVMLEVCERLHKLLNARPEAPYSVALASGTGW